MRFPAFCCGCLLFAAAGTAQAQSDVLPVPGALPKQIPASVPSLPSAYDPVPLLTATQKAAPIKIRMPVSRVENLDQAADHLEAAGLKDEAQRIRAQATLLRHQEKLERKLRDLHKLQEEIRDLYKLTGIGRQVQVDLKIIEVDLDKLQAEGVKLSGFSGERPQPSLSTSATATTGTVLIQTAGTSDLPKEAAKLAPAVKLFDDHGNLTEPGHRLRKAGILKIIARPSLILTPGHPASLRVGGEFPVLIPQESGNVNIEWREYGIRVETLTDVLPGGKIRLELSAESAERDFSNAYKVNGIVVPGLTVRRLNTQLLTESGQTTVISGQVFQHKASDYGQTSRKTRLIIAVTPVLLDNPSPAIPTDAKPTSSEAPPTRIPQRIRRSKKES